MMHLLPFQPKSSAFQRMAVISTRGSGCSQTSNKIEDKKKSQERVGLRTERHKSTNDLWQVTLREQDDKGWYFLPFVAPQYYLLASAILRDRQRACASRQGYKSFMFNFPKPWMGMGQGLSGWWLKRPFRSTRISPRAIINISLLLSSNPNYHQTGSTQEDCASLWSLQWNSFFACTLEKKYFWLSRIAHCLLPLTAAFLVTNGKR